MAADGITYGQIGTYSNYAVNYQPGQTVSFNAEPDVLMTSSANANAYLNLIFQGSLISDITLHGFAESFYKCGDFWLEGINTFIYSEEAPVATDIAVKVFERDGTSVSTTEIAQLVTAGIHPCGNKLYCVTFKPESPVFVTSAMQVVVLPREGSGAQFSVLMPLQKSYHASNQGTASLYADFKFAGKKAYKQYWDFYGTELSDDTGEHTVGFLNHWAIGIKGSYTEPASVTVAESDPAGTADDTAVYSITGVRVADSCDKASLRPGLYISGGRKIIVR